MAMQLRPGGDEPDVLIEINTTPLIDVMLVLLIMLIVTIPIQLHAVNLDLPVATPPPATPPVVVRIDIDARGTVLWQGEALADAAALDARLREAAAAQPAPELHLRPDRDARYEAVAGVLAATKRHGLTKIGIVGAEQFAAPR
jgi:biopolymer transport protein ExbD